MRLSLKKNYLNWGARKIIENIDNIIKGKVKLKEQNHSDATYAEKINKKERKIIWE